MKARKVIRTIETYTLGQPTRNVVSGFRHVPGKTMAEKFTYMREHEDWLRKLLCYEPRGSEISDTDHRAMHAGDRRRRPVF